MSGRFWALSEQREPPWTTLNLSVHASFTCNLRSEPPRMPRRGFPFPLFGNVSNFDQRVGVATRHDAIVTPHRKIRQMTRARELVENNAVETKRYTMAELYELRRLLIRHSRSMPPGPARNGTGRLRLRCARSPATKSGWPPMPWMAISRAASDVVKFRTATAKTAKVDVLPRDQTGHGHQHQSHCF